MRHLLEKLDFPRLVIIDGLDDLCPSRRQEENAMRVLSLLAAQYSVAVIVVARSQPRQNKHGQYQPPTNQILSRAPIVWSLVRDEEEPTKIHFLPTRLNYGEPAVGFTFRIGKKGRIEWGELDNQPLVPDTPLVTEWLTSILQERDVPARELYELGDRVGISKGMIARAGKKLGFRSERTGFGGVGHWYWTSKPPEKEPDELAWLDQPVTRPRRRSSPDVQTEEVPAQAQVEQAPPPSADEKPIPETGPEPSQNGQAHSDTLPLDEKSTADTGSDVARNGEAPSETHPACGDNPADSANGEAGDIEPEETAPGDAA